MNRVRIWPTFLAARDWAAENVRGFPSWHVVETAPGSFVVERHAGDASSRVTFHDGPVFVDLSHPIRSERVRGFQPPWRTVYVYRCEHGHTLRVYANAFRGSQPEPSRGAIECTSCRVLAEWRAEAAKGGEHAS